jgi:hypothetical protein
MQQHHAETALPCVTVVRASAGHPGGDFAAPHSGNDGFDE